MGSVSPKFLRIILQRTLLIMQELITESGEGTQLT
jgi:hypothetical protein